jgi:hypothetical protein
VSFHGFLFAFYFPVPYCRCFDGGECSHSVLEAELNASRKAWDTATAAKVAAEKSAKSAAIKAKKAEKALADADQGRVQREQVITKCLNQISTLAGGKYRVVLFLSICSFF